MAEHADFRCRCNLFFMELVTLFCFGDSRDPVHEDVFAMLMSYVICEDNRTQDFTPFADHGIDPTPVVRSFLLQQLLRSRCDKSDRFQISPPASRGISHHTV